MSPWNRRAARTLLLALILAGVYARSADAAIPAGFVKCNEGLNHPVRLLNNLVCPGNGIRVIADDVVLDLNGHVVSGDGDSGDVGIVVNGRKNVTVRNGTISRFNIGLHAGASTDSTFENLTVTQNTLRGFDLNGSSSNNVIQHNLITGNTENGIEVDASPDVKVLSNKIIGNQQDGILFNPGSDNGKIDGNKVIGNAQGIVLTQTSDPVTNNETASSKIDGIVISQAPAVTVISGNNSHDNAGEGISVSSNATTVKNNTTNDNGDDGIFVAVSQFNNKLIGNTANNNNSNGIDTASNIFAKNNTAKKNGFQNGIEDNNGFGLRGGANSAGNGNHVSGNDGLTQCSPTPLCA